MKDEEIEEILQRGSRIPQQLEPALLKRIADSIHPSLRPVRPLPPPWVLTGGLILVCAAVALAGAARTGFNGIANLGPWERVVIFATLSILGWIVGRALVAELIPGSRHRFSPYVLLTIVTLALLGVFALLFRDYRSDHFLSAGLACLLAGSVVALPAGLFSWLLLRRGFAVNPLAAGLVGGALAGVSGVTMLELQCPNFQALHVLVWHAGVIPLCAGAGAILGSAFRVTGPLRRPRDK